MNLDLIAHEKYREALYQLREIEQEIQKLPSGSLACYQSGEYTKWVRYHNGKKSYLNHKQRDLAEQLAYKTYLIRKQKKLLNLCQAIGAFQLVRSKMPKRQPDQLLQKEVYRELLSPFVDDYAARGAEWATADYARKTDHPESLTQQCACGLFVRSKSEAIIADALTRHHIWFRYECRIVVNGTSMYPDFMIMHPKTGKIMIWEHFGMADDEAYRETMLIKMRTYILGGWVPMHNLILTFETKDQPLTPYLVEQIINSFLAA